MRSLVFEGKTWLVKSNPKGLHLTLKTVCLGLGLVSGILLSTGGKVAASESVCVSQLDQHIEAIIEDPQWVRSRFGIVVKSLEKNDTLYNLEGDEYFIVASNVKLLTTAAALRYLGSNFRISTKVYGQGTLPNLTELRVIGKGDPSLTTEQLEDLAQQLKEKGVKSISRLVIEDSYFKGLPIDPTWEWSDLLFYYAPLVQSLMLNQNTVTLTATPQEVGKPLNLVWSDPLAAQQWQIKNNTQTTPKGTEKTLDFHWIFPQKILEITGNLPLDAEEDKTRFAIPDPLKYFQDSFSNILSQAGITVSDTLITQETSSTGIGEELGVIESPPLSSLIAPVNQESNNLFAEALFKILGTQEPDKTSSEMIQETLTKLGVNGKSYLLIDGSGLSRRNLVSPSALVNTLVLMAKSPEGEIYRNSLAVAGEKGSLKKRFKDTPIVGHLRGKTGGLTGVVSLSGYLEMPNSEPLVFSIVVNNTDQKSVNSIKIVDEIVLLLSRLKRC